MNLFYYKHIFTLNSNDSHIDKLLLTPEAQIGVFEYRIEQITESTFEFVPKQEISFFVNSFLPSIKVNILSENEIKVEFVLTKTLKVMLMAFLGLILLLEFLIIACMFDYMYFELFPLFLPIGIYSLVVTISLICFRMLTMNMLNSIRGWFCK